ncbi:carbamoyltransferase HypF [Amycolatopsis vancoresmycina]|uniref:Carbamoyltransferase n=1 Tax=Amycolatopsis vancoresmycina DSM 44592 TaxID=1292037 RepID=R1FWD6_9PSEU|nr:carbamoyltransferase HypF [Amycolatopsis vancoresmycina]EOD63723.1 hydrogenase maturation protein HypF [Amycolatopsis vancoresmycina DSM 44592]
MRVAVRVVGVVQGVGFRPFVHQLAVRLGLSGFVGNDVHGVFAEVEGTPSAVDRFVGALRAEAPPLAVVDAVRVREIPAAGGAGFRIVGSPHGGGGADTLVSADSATCADCLRELADPTDRRFRYPFVNCTNCGPRFTIVRGVPYDRPLTTMAAFAMCAECKQEYEDPADRRFHAQPVCCPACGPALRFEPGGGEPIPAAAEALRDGAIVAVKGLGGYHLAAGARHEEAARRLRQRKHREDKPFAVMVADLAQARELAEVDDPAERALTGRRRPIVLLPKKADLAAAVAPGNRRIGLMLPYTPLHHLLLERTGPIVLTSANVSDEPIVYRDEDLGRLDGIADAFLVHDRPIHVRTDDSVVRVFRNREQLQRRSRGYAPEPVTLHTPAKQHLLGCGAELKNTFCLAKGRHAFVSHHIGDLENYETLKAFTEGIEHFKHLFAVDPVLVAHDLHPEYLSTKYALEQDVDLLGVQHHHAHIAACLADNGEDGPVLGVAFDGTGFGPDGTVWGGEFLLADLASYERLTHLRPVAMPGGVMAIRQPWRMAASYLDELGRPAREDIVKLKRSGLNSPLTSSAGRLFDAAAALLGVRERITYEGQAAIELEQLADPAERSAYRARIDDVVHGEDLIAALLDDDGPKAARAARFHNGVADAIARTCDRFRDRSTTVALSGGVFQNVLLLDRAVELLEQTGFRVLTHRNVPTNDGGISFGQVAVASRTTR